MRIYVYVYSSMSEAMKTTQLPPILRAVADSTRLKILLMLESKPRTVGEIVDFFDLSQPTITRHLQTLATAGLVKRSRKGQNVYYELAVDMVKMMCSDLVACFPCCCVTAPSEGAAAMPILKIEKLISKRASKKNSLKTNKEV
ncbi:hypothetical protein C3F09_10090 [candidate division GN15 bacterium]|uniref:HTH arsR-type domain-containing protein n=1 Tax=candidate division GN15 bacterium TaxID=2072418 RepID=A0A855X4D8_9BACT|nr:MAG: hypothetical protein C3F09_10090 [candidate division GN15 bacterium]